MVKARSMRGQVVDFDLIRIKRQMAAAPKTTDVKAREDFIERRLRRRVKRPNPLTELRKGVSQTPQQPVVEQPPVKPALRELAKQQTKAIEPEVAVEAPKKRKRISRRTKKTEK